MSINPDDIDAILPQTQCGLCGYGGCMPYAEAIAYEGAAIHLCPPGGVKTLCDIAALTKADPTPFIAAMEQKQKKTSVARIREEECIGCTKCISACPVDAILGSAKQMHSILRVECTGCELCIAPCPVDCIDMIVITEATEEEKKQKANLARTRFNDRQARLAQMKKKKEQAALSQSLNKKRDYIQEAIQRAKMKATR